MDDIERTLVFKSDYPYIVTNIIDGESSTAGVILATYSGDEDKIPNVSFDDYMFTAIFLPYDEIDIIIGMLQEFKDKSK